MILVQLDSWPVKGCKKIQKLKAEVSDDVCVVNACKCIHVLKSLAHGSVILLFWGHDQYHVCRSSAAKGFYASGNWVGKGAPLLMASKAKNALGVE